MATTPSTLPAKGDEWLTSSDTLATSTESHQNHSSSTTAGAANAPVQSLSVSRSIENEKTSVETLSSQLKTFLRFIGPGFMVAVGYMDPGNWATDLAAGSQYGYSLLYIILISSIVTMVLQYLCIKLGVVTGNDLATACRKRFSPFWNIVFYILCELAIVACDLAEVIGTAIGLNLLFNLPLPWGIAITALDVLVILALWGRKGLRIFEWLIMALVLSVAACFIYLVYRSKPDWGGVAYGYVPKSSLFTEDGMLYVAMGIVGATIMPHNLYIHSNIVRFRADFDESVPLGEIQKEPAEKKEEERPTPLQPTNSTRVGPELEDFEDESRWNSAKRMKHIPKLLWFTQIDSFMALTLAFVINSSILTVSSSNFYRNGNTDVAEIRDAFNLIVDYLGRAAGIVFAVALLLAGQSSTMTGTIAGQIVMEGFLGGPKGIARKWKIPAWSRRLFTRVVAIIPAMIVALVGGETGVGRLLVGSQVVLSLQLPFAIWPLVIFTSSRLTMTVQVDEVQGAPATTTWAKFCRIFSRRGGDVRCYVNGWILTVIAYLIAAVITIFNIILILQVAGAF
ncbi:hypothetical protein HDU97_006081 [Phlyctochytrium planicorne]|nr:hypothetical protein HDU97_006081 [Phlyctochytrium planicorne]